MTIEEFKEKKKDVETQITKLLMDFQKESGVKINGITSVRTSRRDVNSAETREFLTGIKIEINFND